MHNNKKLDKNFHLVLLLVSEDGRWPSRRINLPVTRGHGADMGQSPWLGKGYGSGLMNHTSQGGSSQTAWYRCRLHSQDWAHTIPLIHTLKLDLTSGFVSNLLCAKQKSCHISMTCVNTETLRHFKTQCQMSFYFYLFKLFLQFKKKRSMFNKMSFRKNKFFFFI